MQLTLKKYTNYHLKLYLPMYSQLLIMRDTCAEEKSSRITLSLYTLTLHSAASLSFIPEIKDSLIFLSVP